MANASAYVDAPKLLSRLRLVQLGLLCGVADGYSFRQLAERMALSPPAISKMAREMESALGEAVFLRERNGVRLTVLGELLAYDARLIVRHVARIEENVDSHRAGVGAIIKIGSPSYTAVSLLSGPVSQLIRQHPTAKIELIDGVADTLFGHLKAGEIDFLVGSLPIHALDDELSPLLEVEELYPDEICFLAHKSSKRSDRPLALSELQHFSWIMPSRDSLIRSALRNAMLMEGLPIPRASVESSVVPAIGALVSENVDFVGVLRADAAHYLAQRLDLTVLKTQQRIPLPPMAIIRRRHSEPVPIAKDLFVFIKDRVGKLFSY